MLTENDSFLELVDFTKIYGSGKKAVTGCEKVSLKACKGEVTGLLGLNGAGKSTILKALCGYHYATEGSVFVAGTESNLEIRNITGFVPEFPQLDPSLTVKETLYLEADLHKVEKRRQSEYVDKAIELCELDEVIYQKVATLSKGYLQRTSFAKAICFDSKVLVLDEFSGGLDPSQIINMRKTIKLLAKEKIVILSTHHIEEAEALCNKIYIMHKGKMEACGSIDEVVKSSGKKNLEEAFLFYAKQEKLNSDE